MGLRQICYGIEIAVKTFSPAEGNVNVQTGKLGIMRSVLTTYVHDSTTLPLDELEGLEAGKLGSWEAGKLGCWEAGMRQYILNS